MIPKAILKAKLKVPMGLINDLLFLLSNKIKGPYENIIVRKETDLLNLIYNWQHPNQYGTSTGQVSTIESR